MIKTGSDFSGVGAFEQALIRLGIEHETVFSCDMDKYARQTYILNFGEPKYYPENVYDREIPVEPLDIYMSSLPCQAFSLAGKRKGEADKRGILFYNTHEFIKVNQPKYFIIENVKGLLSDDGGKTFARWLDLLGGKSVNGNTTMFAYPDSVPYHIHYQVLNAKHYGIPQNRERVFIVGIREDVGCGYSFPKRIPLVKRLRDVLESEVDEKYYLSDKMVNYLHNASDTHKFLGNGFEFKPRDPDSTATAITARCFKQGCDDNYIAIPANKKQGYEIATAEDSIAVPNSKTRRGRVGKGVAQTLDTSCNQGVLIGAIRGRNPENPTSRVSGLETQQMLEINEAGISNALTTVQKDNVVVETEPIIRQAPRGYNKGADLKICPSITTNSFEHNNHVVEGDIIEHRGHLNKPAKIYRHGIAPALRAESHGHESKILSQQRIRRLTPLECFRLMDFNETFTWNVSDSQAYKQAGNSICVGVLAAIIKNLNP